MYKNFAFQNSRHFFKSSFFQQKLNNGCSQTNCFANLTVSLYVYRTIKSKHMNKSGINCKWLKVPSVKSTCVRNIQRFLKKLAYNVLQIIFTALKFKINFPDISVQATRRCLSKNCLNSRNACRKPFILIKNMLMFFIPGI